MDPEQAAKLREPFPDAVIGQLPRTVCRECKDSRSGVCDKPGHVKARCDGTLENLPKGCGNYMTTAHIHLDYVGHAGVTDRLLQVDPEWTWQPMATNPDTGAPLMADGGLWIELTVCGLTRPGFGDGKDMKERIGDAIRNGAMRFGVALDLWAKEDLHAEPPANPADPDIIEDVRARLKALPEDLGRQARDAYRQQFGQPDNLTASQAPAAVALVIEWEQKAEGDKLAEPGSGDPEGDGSEAMPPPKPPPAPPKGEPDRIDWKAFGKELGLKQIDVLNTARDVAEAAGLEKPGSLQKVPAEIETDLAAALTQQAALTAAG